MNILPEDEALALQNDLKGTNLSIHAQDEQSNAGTDPLLHTLPLQNGGINGMDASAYSQDEQTSADNDPLLHSVAFSSPTCCRNAISWSRDDRLSVISNSCIYILKFASSNILRRPSNASVGFEVETSTIANTKRVSSDVGITNPLREDTTGDGSFLQRAECTLDRSTVPSCPLTGDVDHFAALSWSPLGMTADGRSVLATVTMNGSVRIYRQQLMLGCWNSILDVTDMCRKYMSEMHWNVDDLITQCAENSPSENCVKAKLADENRTMNGLTETNHYDDVYSEFGRRRKMLHSTCICWCPVPPTCQNCRLLGAKRNFENSYFSRYHETYAKCRQSASILATANRLGVIFIWLIVLDLLSDNAEAQILSVFQTSIEQPVCMSWVQVSECEAFLAVGFSNGLVQVHSVLSSFTGEGIACKRTKSITAWAEEDSLSVSFVEWICQDDGVLYLVAAKFTDILLFKIIKTDDDIIQCDSVEVAPSCHSTRIMSLQCVANQYVITSSQAASQYFDIKNKGMPFCENNMTKGYSCFGISALENLTMLARVSSHARMIYLQSPRTKHMEISFFPFRPPDEVAMKLLAGNIPLDMLAREYLAVTASESFQLPECLHKYCYQPESCEGIKPEQLQLYLYLNGLRLKQQTRAAREAQQEVAAHREALNLERSATEQTIAQLERLLESAFVSEMLNKCVQLIDVGWVEKREEELLSLLLMADWLVLIGDVDSLCVALKCYSMLEERDSIDALEQLMTAPQGLQTSREDESPSLKKLPDAGVKMENVDASVALENGLDHAEEVDRNMDLARQNESSAKSTAQPLASLRLWSISREKCPVCDADVALTSLRTSKCASGHAFARCALTLRALDEDDFRVCTGCARKAKARCFEGELNVFSILLNVDTCPVCGCRFVDPCR